jgi:hypothetical protein
MPTNNISAGKINKFKIVNGSEGLWCGDLGHNTDRLRNGGRKVFRRFDTDLLSDILP